jgi:hypothetical protein
MTVPAAVADDIIICPEIRRTLHCVHHARSHFEQIGKSRTAAILEVASLAVNIAGRYLPDEHKVSFATGAGCTCGGTTGVRREMGIMSQCPCSRLQR